MLKEEIMEENKQDELTRAYVKLSSLRKSIAQMSFPIPEKYVHEFHKALDKLEDIGIDIAEFRIPGSELKHRDTAAAMYVGRE